MDKVEVGVSQEVVGMYPDAYVFAERGSVQAKCLTYWGGGEQCVLIRNMVVRENGVALKERGVVGCRGCVNGGSSHGGGK